MYRPSCWCHFSMNVDSLMNTLILVFSQDTIRKVNTLNERSSSVAGLHSTLEQKESGLMDLVK